jgi:hypothetical protein
MFLSGYTKRKKLTIDNTKIDASLTNFPVRVSLSDDADIGAVARSDGYDIRFTSSDGETLLKYERESFAIVSDKATGEFHVKIPSVSSSADTEFYIYYGKSDASDGADPENVWDSNFKAVHHLKDNTTSTVLDSTSNNVDGTKKGANEPNQVDGKIAKAQDFDGSDDRISLGDNLDFEYNEAFTLEAVVKADAVSHNEIISKQEQEKSGQEQGWELRVLSGYINFTFGRNDVSYYRIYCRSTNKLSTATWYHVVMAYDGTFTPNGYQHVKFYINGVLETSVNLEAASPTSPATTRNANNCYIGTRSYDRVIFWNGIIDEVRVSNIERNAAYAKATYNSNFNSLLTYGTEEATLVLSEIVSIQVQTAFSKLYETTLTQSLLLSSQYVGQIGKSFLEILGISELKENILSAVKTLSEIISVIGQATFSNTKTFIENIIINPLHSTVLASQKTFSEIINVVDSSNVSKIFFETFTEVVNIINPTITKVLSAIRIIPERVVMAGAVLNSTGKTFTEILQVAEQRFLQKGKIYIETVAVSLTNVFLQIKTFFETIKMQSIRTILQIKIFTETISIVETFKKVLEAVKVFTENVNITFTKAISFGKILTETVNIISAYTQQQAKVLVERITGATNWLIEKTQYIELTDVVVAGVDTLKQTARVFSEIIKITPGLVFAVAKTFIETIGIAVQFLIARAIVLAEVLEIVLTFGNFAIGKLFNEVAKIGIIFTEGRNIILTEAIKVIDTIIFSIGKLLNEVINIGSVIAGWGIGKLLHQTVKIDDTKAFRKTQYKTLSDVINVAGAVYNKAGLILKEVISAVDALGSWVIGKVIVQPVYIVASYLKEWTLSRVLLETVQVAGNVFNQAGKIFIEIVSASSEFILGTISKVLTEIVSIFANATKYLPKTLTEAINVAGSILNQAVLTLQETINVVSTFVLGTISKLLTETLNIVETYLKVWTLSRVYEEVVKVVSLGVNQAGKIFTETINATGTFVLGTISKLFIEVVSVAGNATKYMPIVLSEFLIVVDKLTNFWGHIFTEIVNVLNPETAKSIGRTFTENIVAGWAKIKSVLNGIQVGLWKKVARISGVWRKISRNDN